MSGPPFSSDAYALGRDEAGRDVRLAPLAPDAARDLARIFAGIDPWKKVNWPAARLESFLSGGNPGTRCFLIRANDGNAGAVAVSAPWLHGAYLHLLGIVPEFQSQGLGALVIGWFEDQARGHHRNLWICVSAFNHRAERFYDRHGYSRAAALKDLVIEGQDEILLRKKI